MTKLQARAWVPANADMHAVVAKMNEQYVNETRPARNAWFGHPVRLTVKGKERNRLSSTPIAYQRRPTAHPPTSSID
ncbi:MAG: hypothetical protein HC888_10400 [Candidatus Competibacteraceae bacterium]|nr:hypothetical protein [Candidatus Competibacteraceae bacterium]